MISGFKSLRNWFNITLINLDVGPFYEIENTAIGVIITIKNHDLVGSLHFLRYSIFCQGFVAGSAIRRGHFVLNGASTSATKTAKMLNFF